MTTETAEAALAKAHEEIARLRGACDHIRALLPLCEKPKGELIGTTTINLKTGDIRFEPAPPDYVHPVEAAERWLAALAGADAPGPAGDGWRETSRELPPEGERVLCLFSPSRHHRPSHAVLKFHGVEQFGWEWSQPGNGYCLDEVSHWQPLPPAPSEAARQEGGER